MKDKVRELAEKLVIRPFAGATVLERIIRAELRPLLDAIENYVFSGDIEPLAAELEGWRKEKS